jgi:hypothetical protein
MISMSCAKSTTEIVRNVSDYCLIAKGITYSEKRETQEEGAENLFDTPETIVQIKNHDLTFERLCSGNPE